MKSHLCIHKTGTSKVCTDLDSGARIAFHTDGITFARAFINISYMM